MSQIVCVLCTVRMDHFLIFVVISILGIACAGVVRRDAATATQGADISKSLTDLTTLFMGLASQYQSISQPTASGNSAPTIDTGAAIQDALKNLLPNTSGGSINYGLSETMKNLNQSLGLPTIDTTDTSSMTREQFLEHVQKQTRTFSNIMNANMELWLVPNRVVKYLNITNQYNDPAVVNNPQAEAALQREYQNLMMDFQRDLQEKLNGRKPSSTTADRVNSTAVMEVLQQQIAGLESMYNKELSQALPAEDVQGALSGITDDAYQNLGKAVMNIFQNIGRRPGPFNSQMHRDFNQ